MIDARQWTPPSAAEIGALVDSLPWSQRETAERLGVGRQSLLRWMGRAKPPLPIPYTAWLALRQIAEI